MKATIALDYNLPEGALQPYFEGVRKGIARASRCGNCGFVAFPARLICGACGCAEVSWVELSGKAQVRFRTECGTTSFALVSFDGADTNTMVGLVNPENRVESGTLAKPRGDRPGLWLLLDDEITKGDRNDG